MEEEAEPQRLYNVPKVKQLESNRSRIEKQSGARVPVSNHLHASSLPQKDRGFPVWHHGAELQLSHWEVKYDAEEVA